MKHKPGTGAPVAPKTAAADGRTYFEREMALVEAICKDDGTEFDSVEDGLKFVGYQMKAFPDYVNTAVTYAQRMPIVYAQPRSIDRNAEMESLESGLALSRTRAADAANILNRACNRMGIEPFADVDTKDPKALDDFCGRYVNETFNLAVGGTLAELVKEKGVTYDEKKIDGRLKEAAQSVGIDGHQQDGDGMSL